MASRGHGILFGVVAMISACAPERPAADATDGVVGTSSESSTGEEGLDDCSEDSGESTDTESDEGSPDCDIEAFEACEQPLFPAYLSCTASCPETVLSCGEATCAASCELERNLADLACQTAAHCNWSFEEAECTRDCWLDYSDCIAPPDCNLHGCQWDLGPCLTSCVHCIIPVELDFAYEGVCELPLPDLLDPIVFWYTWIEIADQTLGVVDSDMTCGEPQVGALVQDDVLLLCPSACDAFEQAGSLRVVISGPSCP